MHTLYIVGTPIGNLEDITPRALDVLREVRLIASENPSRTQRLLARHDIHTPMRRFTDAYDRKKAVRLSGVLEALTHGDVALVSEAGMPLLADPGYELVQAVLQKGICVEVIPGPAALTAALAVSGLAPKPFVFLGFVPRQPTARRRLLRTYIRDPRSLVLYESPNRLADTLRDALVELGARRAAVANELTKLYESVWRGDLGSAVAKFETEKPRGEYVVVIDGAEEA
jgi:16S rRNA (cytidine1402-2'-O)-methyltransferase